MRADDQEVRAGKLLFTRDWQLNDPISGRGDGLGPMFNARSCVACHNQGGLGGGGDVRHNADLVTAIAVNGATPEVRNFKGVKGENSFAAELANQAQASLNEMAPAFRRSSSIVVHRFGSEPEYESVRAKLLGLSPGERLGPTNVLFFDQFTVDFSANAINATDHLRSISFQRSQRNTPSLFGAGAIERISKKALENVQRRQPRLMLGSAAGRFGWHGQTADLKEFVLGACANELGLQTPGHFQARDPQQPRYFSRESDMDETQIEELVGFVASLPPPRAILPQTLEEQIALGHGAKLFKEGRCHICHVPEVGGVQGLYSDLLTHDMGPALSDPAGLQTVRLETSPPQEEEPSSPGTPAGYYWSSAQLARQWRTPPLWGVRYTAPYLHDGRAATLEDAIRLHGGQAAPSAKFFEKLPNASRRDLLAFVRSLGAPPTQGEQAQGEEVDKQPVDHGESVADLVNEENLFEDQADNLPLPTGRAEVNLLFAASRPTPPRAIGPRASATRTFPR
ncbi:MAG: hypothetical protein K8T25_12465 [Planctomycetia bacterium]|nr:hypothetical protein [Planctomycetia bacterium]